MHFIDRIFERLTRRSTIGEAGLAGPAEPQFYSDIPIAKAQDDLLGRREFATALATTIYRYKSEESLIIALRGKWGSGKSSIKNLVLEDLRGRPSEPMRVVDFNPWQWSGDEATSKAFYREIAAALGDAEKTVAGRLRAYEFQAYANRLHSFSSGVKAVAEKSNTFVGWFASFGLLAAGLGLSLPKWPVTRIASALLMVSGILSIGSKILAWHFKIGDDNRPIEIIREALKIRLRTLPRNVLVVIDDIDRLEPEQIRHVIRTVKANANLPGLTYLILYQKEVVEAAFDPVAADNGAQYLEKIMQVTFDVPIVEGERVLKVLTNGLDKILAPYVTEHPRFATVRLGNILSKGVRYFFHTLRDVRRYEGAISVQATLQAGNNVFEVNILDMLALECLRIFEPEVYQSLAKSKALLLRDGDGRAEDKETIKQLIDSASVANKDAVENIVRELFPRVEWAFGGMYFARGSHQEWVSDRRICSPRHFDRYFSMRLTDGQISDSEFADFLENAKSRDTLDAAFEDYRERGLLEDLLSRLDEVNRKLPREIASTFIPALFDVGDTVSNEFGFTIESPFISAWRTASWYLRAENDQQQRGSLFVNSLQNSKGLGVPAVLIGLDKDARKKREPSTEFIMLDDHFEVAKAIWCRKFEKLTRTPELLIERSNFINLLYRWREFSESNTAEAWMTAAIRDLELVKILLTAFMATGQSYVYGDAVATTTRYFNIQNLSGLLDVTEFAKQVEKLENSELSREQLEAKAAFQTALATFSEGAPSE